MAGFLIRPSGKTMMKPLPSYRMARGLVYGRIFNPLFENKNDAWHKDYGRNFQSALGVAFSS